ncbi:hypothetical protein RZS08_20855, partial [Arthrospira platensis SPKY1]|nr:hypothetical protein [Arthrospira platensis SPKY1]
PQLALGRHRRAGGQRQHVGAPVVGQHAEHDRRRVAGLEPQHAPLIGRHGHRAQVADVQPAAFGLRHRPQHVPFGTADHGDGRARVRWGGQWRRQGQHRREHPGDGQPAPEAQLVPPRFAPCGWKQPGFQRG